MHAKGVTKTGAPGMVAAFAIGPDIAAEMLVTTGDNDDRIRSDGALTKLCGACPIPAGRARPTDDTGLNRGGNRQRTLPSTARSSSASCHSHDCLRRTAEGLQRELIRCLKRLSRSGDLPAASPPSVARELATAA